MMLAVPESWVKKALPMQEPRKDTEGGLGAWHVGQPAGCIQALQLGGPTAEVPPQGPCSSQMLSLLALQALHHLLPGWIPGLRPTLLCPWLSIQSHTELRFHLPSFPSCLKAAQYLQRNSTAPYHDPTGRAMHAHSLCLPVNGSPKHRVCP